MGKAEICNTFCVLKKLCSFPFNAVILFVNCTLGTASSVCENTSLATTVDFFENPLEH